MSDQFWLTETQLKHIDPLLPKVAWRSACGRPSCRQWDYPCHPEWSAMAGWPHKTLYTRFVRWSRMDIFDRIFANLAAESEPSDRMMIDSTHPKAHRTAASLLKKGIRLVASVARKAD